MNYVIYGAGHRGKRFLDYIDEKKVCAFIDADTTKQGKIYHGVPIISLDEYMMKYESCFIVVTPAYNDDIEEMLRKNKIYQYSNLADMPSEFAGYGDCKFEDCYGTLKHSYEKLCIYGSNALSFLIYDFLSQGKQVSIYPEERHKISKIMWLKKYYPEIELVNETEIQENEIILVSAVGEYDNRFSNKTLNLFEYANNNISYRNEKLLKFKDAYKNNKKCFIVATGPSLNVEDLHVLTTNNIFCFSVNNIIKIRKEWMADAYVVTDSQFISDNMKSIEEYNCNLKFVGDSCEEYWAKDQKDSNKIHVAISGAEIDFSEEVEQKLYCGYRGKGTVTYVCLQLAIYMGFSEIYLLGVDCNYIRGSKNNHFIAEEREDNKNHGVEGMIKAYEYAKKYADAHNIKIYNATRGGMLEVFERIDFDVIFENKG